MKYPMQMGDCTVPTSSLQGHWHKWPILELIFPIEFIIHIIENNIKERKL